jgi:hypothetical protein
VNPLNRRAAPLAVLAAVGGVLASTGAGAAQTSLPTQINAKHVMWGAGQGYPSTQEANQNNLIYHGGLVETTPAVYIVYWGPSWQSGFTFKDGTSSYSAKAIENYVNSFFANVGGSAWAGVSTQYCQNMDPGFSCAGQPFAQFVTSPTHQLKGVWVDPSPVPSDIVTTGLVENDTNDPLETEALAAAQHFGYNINATYFILTEPGIAATAYGSVYCAYHSETGHTTGHGVRYAFIPFVPEQGSGCGENSVNTKNDGFGNGALDGYSIVAGHEYMEAITDPDNQNGTQDGWNDVQTNENGDKCAWTDLQNISLGGHLFAVQPTWSNEANAGAGGCAYHRG